MLYFKTGKHVSLMKLQDNPYKKIVTTALCI